MNTASDLVRAGMERTGVPLTANLAAYLALTFLRFIDRRVDIDRLTYRVSQAMTNRAGRDELRMLADECLIGCALFEARLRRVGSVRHYVGLGQATYDAARYTEQAYGFVPMRDVMAGAIGASEAAGDDLAAQLDRARAGSATARAALGRAGVLVGPWGRPQPGLRWT